MLLFIPTTLEYDNSLEFPSTVGIASRVTNALVLQLNFMLHAFGHLPLAYFPYTFSMFFRVFSTCLEPFLGMRDSWEYILINITACHFFYLMRSCGLASYSTGVPD